MAVTFDNKSTAVAAGAASIQWTHTVSGTNTYLILNLTNDSAFSYSSAAYNGVALTRRGFVTGGVFLEGWDLAGANTGALTASATVTGGAGAACSAAGTSYNGVAQANPRTGIVSATDTNVTNHNLSVASQANGLVFGTILTITGALSAGASQTVRFSVSAGTVQMTGCTKAGGATVSLSWTSAAISSAMLAFAISDTAAGAVTLVPNRMMLSTGT